MYNVHTCSRETVYNIAIDKIEMITYFLKETKSAMNVRQFFEKPKIVSVRYSHDN